MTENTLIVTEQSAMMPLMDMQMAIQRFSQVAEFVQEMMRKDIDFGIIPGTSKPTLLKPGAEKLTTFFGLSKQFEIIEKVEDWTGEAHNGEPFFYYLYRCKLSRGNILIAESDGSCNSFEVKYRYRKSERVCPDCGLANIRKSKQGGGWYCWQKTGGCGSTFANDDVNIERQETGRIINPDICDQVNTFQKMGQKRALVAATLLAVNASEFFTQDIEDYIIGAIAEKQTILQEPKQITKKAETVIPPSMKLQNGNKREPERNHLDDLFDDVQFRTNNYYQAKAHLYQVLEEWPMKDDEDAIGKAIVKAVQHVSRKIDEKAAKEE